MLFNNLTNKSNIYIQRIYNNMLDCDYYRFLTDLEQEHG